MKPRGAILWSATALLVVFGLAASAARTFSVLETGAWSAGPVQDLSSLDQANLDMVAAWLGIERGSAKYLEGEAQQRRMFRKFNHYPITTLLHVVPATLFLVIAPLQFSRAIRNRYRNWHRWSGRVIVATAIPIAASGLFFGLFMPFSGLVESAAIALFGTIFVFALVRAFVAIRTADVATHRVWMIRMFAVAIGVSTVRVAGTVLATITREGPEVWFASSVWIGMGLTSAAAELWIRHSRGSRLPTP